MNYAANILKFLSGSEEVSEVILAAGAPPVTRKDGKLQIVIDSILNPGDIRETLSTFCSHTTTTGAGAIGKDGVFSFGMAGMGRFRVQYFTQRGSVVALVRKVPGAIPELDSLVTDPDTISLLDKAISEEKGGIVLIVGPSARRNVELAYALLNRVNRSKGKVLFAVEHDLSFLLRYEESITMQSEVGPDVGSLEEGIGNGLLLSPDIMYVRDGRSRNEVIGIMQAAEAGVLVLASVVSFSEEVLMTDLEARLDVFYTDFCRLLKKIIKVVPIDKGKIGVAVSTWTAGKRQ